MCRLLTSDYLKDEMYNTVPTCKYSSPKYDLKPRRCTRISLVCFLLVDFVGIPGKTRPATWKSTALCFVGTITLLL